MTNLEQASRVDQSFDPDWCYAHMVDKLSCVHCTFPPDELIFLFECARCQDRTGTRSYTWGWRDQCVRCIGMHIGCYSVIESRELVLVA